MSVRESTRASKRALAEASLTKLQGEVAASWITPDLRLADAVDEWLREKRTPPHDIRSATLRDYRWHCVHLLTVMPAGLRLVEISAWHLLQVLDRLQRASAATTSQRKVLTALAMLYRWHVRMGHVQRNPVETVDRPGVASTPTPELAERDYLELQGDAAEAIAATAGPDTRRGLEALLDLLEVLWCSGMRQIDALRLRWEDIDLDQAVWTIRALANKGGQVILPIHRRLVPLLQRRRLLGGEGPFPGVQAFQSIWRRFKAARSRWGPARASTACGRRSSRGCGGRAPRGGQAAGAAAVSGDCRTSTSGTGRRTGGGCWIGCRGKIGSDPVTRLPSFGPHAKGDYRPEWGKAFPSRSTSTQSPTRSSASRVEPSGARSLEMYVGLC